MSDDEEKLFGASHFIDSRRLHTTSLGEAFLTKDAEKRVLHDLVRECARWGIPVEEVLHGAQITWRCEARLWATPTKESKDA